MPLFSASTNKLERFRPSGELSFVFLDLKCAGFFFMMSTLLFRVSGSSMSQSPNAATLDNARQGFFMLRN